MQILGVVLIVLGSISACSTALTPLALLVPLPPGQPRPAISDVVAAIAVYLLVAVVLILSGMGSFRKRRWSRPVILVITGTWALSGLLGLVLWAFVGADMEQAMRAAVAAQTQPVAGGAPAATGPAAPAPPTATIVRSAQVAGVFFLIVFGVLLPAGFFWFYRRKSVQQTLDYFSHGRVWTDGCPTPVLGMSFWLAAASLSTIMYVFSGVIPVFGTLKSGPIAITVLVLMVILLALLAWGIFRLNIAAWWGTTFIVVLVAVSTLLTFSKVDPLEFYRLARTPPEQLEMMKLMGVAGRGTILLPTVLYSVVVLGYLMWILKYFRPAVRIGEESS